MKKPRKTQKCVERVMRVCKGERRREREGEEREGESEKDA